MQQKNSAIAEIRRKGIQPTKQMQRKNAANNKNTAI